MSDLRQRQIDGRVERKISKLRSTRTPILSLSKVAFEVLVLISDECQKWIAAVEPHRTPLAFPCGDLSSKPIIDELGEKRD